MSEEMNEQDNCIRCGLPENHEKHDRTNPPPLTGWHPFRGQEYLDGIEDALLFVRENAQQHEWIATGVIIDTLPSFSEKHCKICGAINWGGKEDGICFGKHQAEKAIISAHNRRAARQAQERRLKDGRIYTRSGKTDV